MIRQKFVGIFFHQYRHECIELTIQQKLYFDSDNESRALTATQVQFNVKKIIAGLKAAGVERGDCVVLHLFNTVTISS